MRRHIALVTAFCLLTTNAIAEEFTKAKLTAIYNLPAIPQINSPELDSPELKTRYIMPARGVLTSGYGRRWGRMHKGIDIAAPVGTPIFAAAPGVVVYARWNSGGYGNLIDIQHPDGSLTRYGHNSRLLVVEGQQVNQGEAIALMGSSGRSTGPHLHFEIYPPGKAAVNPIALINDGL